MRIEPALPIVAMLLAGLADDGGGRDEAAPEEQSGRGASRLRILIVEDEALVALDLENILREAGFEIVGIVDTEADAVAKAEHLRPDVVLMDIALRQGDGISAARQLRDVPTQIVFVSGNSDPGTLAAVHALGPAGFIRKPFAAERLPAQIAQAVARPRN